VLALLGSLLYVIVPAAPAEASTKSPTAKSRIAVSCAAASATDVASAAMLAKKCREAVPVSADQTAFARMTANPDGTMTWTSSVSPRWVRRDDAWVPVDASLVQNKDGSFSPDAAEAGLVLSGGGNSTLASVTASGQGVLAVSWPTTLPAPRVSGATATYPDVLPGVNLAVTAEVTGSFDESLVVENAKAAADPGLSALVLDMSASRGLASSVDRAGNVTFRNAKGKAVFTSPAPRAWDASKHAVPVAVPVSYSGGRATMRAPKALLDGKSTDFPISIDPSVNVDPSYTFTQSWEGYDETQSAYPTTTELNATYNGDVSVGYDGGGVDRGYYVFGLPSAADGATTDVLSASVSATAVTTYSSGSEAHALNAYDTSQVSSTTSWDSAPTDLAGPEAVDFTTTSTTPDQAVPVNVGPWVQSDLQAGGWQFSLGLVNTDEADSGGFVEFGPNPTLTVTYDQAPGAVGSIALSPENWATNGNLYTSSLTPTFQASATDPLGNEVSYEFKVTNGSTVVEDGTSGFVASGATGSLVSGATLTNGTTYQLYVRAFDGTEYGAWSAARSFTTDSTAPPVPTISCAGYPEGTWSAMVAGGTTCTVTDSGSDVSGYQYEYIEGSNYNDPTWGWESGGSVSIPVDPSSDGLYYLVITASGDGGLASYAPWYSFGVGASGAVLSPADGSQTASSVTLQAAVPGSYSQATFEYRVGTTGSFTAIPNHVVYQCGCPVTFPVSTSTNNAGVQTAQLTWYLNRTVPDDGLVQVEAVFSNTSGGTETTPPVSVTLSRTGSGADFGTTSAGPVSVGLQSGNAALPSADVNVPAYGADLTVNRTFNSVNPAAPGIFGPGWVPSIGSTRATSWSSVADDGSYAVLTAGDGATYTFTEGSTSGSTVAYAADESATADGLTLTKNTGTDAFDLADSAGDVTAFGYSTAGADYVPSTITSPGTTASTGIVYNSSGAPLLVVAPDAASSAAPTTACPSPASASTWTAGCRGLSFDYNAAGDVSEIDFVYVDNSGGYHSTPVAEYSYDASGRLATEWDPRLSTPLVQGYTYDETATDADYGRITAYSPAQSAGSNALAPWKFSYDDTATDVNYGKLTSVSRTHSSAFGGGTATDTIDYDVALTTSAGGPVSVDPTTAATWNELDVPVSAVAVWPGGYTPSSTTSPTAADYQYATIDYFDASGRQVNTATYVNGAWALDTTQYDGNGNVTSTLSAANRATALASPSPAATAAQLSTVYAYACDDFGTVSACTGADQAYEVNTDVYSPAHSVNVDGVLETERDHTAYGYDAGAPASDKDADGNPYMLKTSVTTSASTGSSIPGSATADARTTQYLYTNGSDDTGWALGAPLQTVTDPGGLDIVSTTAYNENPALYNGDNLVVDQDQPSDPGGGTAGDTRTVYYTAGANSQVSACGNHPEWANRVCETYPAAQPSDTTTLPTTSYTYNDYLSVLTETRTYGSTGTETTSYSYDADNRPTGAAVTVTGTGMGAAPAATATVYSPATGAATGTETLNASGGVATDITSADDDFGQQVSYTDANGQTTSYTYNLSGQSVGRTTPLDTDTISYAPGGQAVSESDKLAGAFTATYNPDGVLQSETYPDGTVGSYTIDPTGTATQLTYRNSTWAAPITDSITLNAQGDWSSESVLNDSKAFTYDNDDRLTGVQDTDAGSCTTRAYTYDADSNRTGLTSYAAATGGACQDTTPATAETYSLDAADRTVSSTESGTTSSYGYDTQGDVTTTPSADAGGSGNLTATYWADGLLDTQSQGGTTNSYTLDGTLDRYATETDSATGLTTTNDYSDSSDSPSWSTTGNGSWTANVTGLDGGLDAEVTETGSVTLELADLHGDIIATVNPSSDAAPSATYGYTEFGAAEGAATPAGYGYLGGDQRAEANLGGTVLMGARVYNPDTGRFLETDPVFGGNANPYDYVYQNPLTNFDLNGEWCFSWKCLVSGAVRMAVEGLFAGVAGAVVTLCAAMTEGICAGLGYYVVAAVMGAATNVFNCWYDGGCHSIEQYAGSAAQGIFEGLIAGKVGRLVPRKYLNSLENALVVRFAGWLLALTRWL
jgi:RHS repeat-associated protein